MSPPYTVCIIGAGTQGLCALKNVLEESDDGKFFLPTCFDSRDQLGGLWAYTEDRDILTVLRTTLTNTSRWRNCYADFPMEDSDFEGDEVGQKVGKYVYPGQIGFLRYLERYANAFDLKKWIRFNSRVTSISREKGGKRWEVVIRVQTGDVAREERQVFDKIIFASGQYHDPLMPAIAGVEKFKGPVLHSSNYKNGSDFAGKRVLVVGFSNTAGDIATDLVKHANKIYLSHRRGNLIFKRIYQGKPLDLFGTRFKMNIRDALYAIAPVWGQAQFEKMASGLADECWDHKPEWGFRPLPGVFVTNPMMSDTLVPCLRSGTINSMPGVSQIIDEKTIEFSDGTRLELDAIVCCTGYKLDTEMMPEVDFEDVSGAVSNDADTEAVQRVPRLYHNVFPLDNADSLAFMNNWQLGTGICELADLMAMAIVQVWKGNYTLPPTKQMNLAFEKQRDFARRCSMLAHPHSKTCNEAEFRAFLNAAAGTRTSENTGYGLQGWRFWLSDRQFCNLVMYGIDSPHFHRLFDGRRKKWSGAKVAIEEANKLVEEKLGHKPENLEDV